VQGVLSLGSPPASNASGPRKIDVPCAADVAVVGAGVIGLSIAWRLALRGLSVVVLERATAGAGASLAATGMLAAAAEHEPGCHDLLSLALESQRQWPEFRAQLEAQSGHDIDFRECGTLVVALNRDEVERLRFRHVLHKSVYRPGISRGRKLANSNRRCDLRLLARSTAAKTTRSTRGW
jgi:glycine oxidase